MGLKTNLKIISALSKILEESKEKISKKELLKKKSFLIMDRAFICGFSPKTEEGKLLLLDFYEEYRAMPKLDYKEEKTKSKIVKSRYSIEILKKALNVFSAFGDEAVNLYMKTDYPITIENEHLFFYLAPRIGGD